jgi:hypothetical protein
MFIDLLILAAGIYIGFCLGLFISALRLRAVRGRPRDGSHPPPSVPDISQSWAFRLVGIRNCTFAEVQSIAAILRLQ